MNQSDREKERRLARSSLAWIGMERTTVSYDPDLAKFGFFGDENPYEAIEPWAQVTLLKTPLQHAYSRILSYVEHLEKELGYTDAEEMTKECEKGFGKHDTGK